MEIIVGGKKDMNLPVKLLALAKSQGEKEALVWTQGLFTYAELAKTMDYLAAGLQNLGLTKGDRVALQLLNVPEFVIAYYAIMRFGGVVVPLNPLYKGREVEYILADSGAKALITASAFVEASEGVRANLTEFRHLIVTDGEEEPDRILLKDLYLATETDFPELRENELAEIIYTSGTTGRPKGAMLSHKNLCSSASILGEDVQLSPADRTLIVTPLFHIAPQSSFLNGTLIYGGTCYLKERWTNADDILETLQSLRITYFFGVPTMYAFMLDSPKLKSCDLSSLRVPFTGGASLPAEILKKWKEITGADIVEGYGLSETSSGCIRNSLSGLKKPGSSGIAYPGMEVKVIDEQERELPSGQVGEIVVRGPNVMLGYWNNPEATDQVLRNQWLHTGDLAYKDDDDYVFIVDRKKDMIIRGGINIYPREVEEVIYRYPGILEVAVIGVPDRVMGEEVQAYISLKVGTDIDLEELRGFCKQEMIHYKIPKSFIILEQLPKTVSGKTLKTELRKNAQAEA